MSIFSMLEAALRARGWALVRVPVNDRYKSLTELLIDDYVRRLSRPGLDGSCYRNFIADWLYFERPMIDRFRGAEFSAQFEGPLVAIGGKTYPLGGFILHHLQWTRLSPEDAFDLRETLRAVVDRTVGKWMKDKNLTFVPALPEKAFPDRAAADAEAERQIRAFARVPRDLGDI